MPCRQRVIPADAGNLPVGDYVVEILIDGKPVVTRTLEVKE